jgi:penicillin-binding protein 1C
MFKIADLLGPQPPDAAPPPQGVLQVARPDLPPGLRRLDPTPPEGARARDVGGPRILYPPDGAVVAWDGSGVPLEAAGGRGPLRWLIDGRPLPPGAPHRTLYWQPEGAGFVRLTVIDANGRGARATVRLAQ